MAEVDRPSNSITFWVAELFHANGNSAGVYWSGGARTHDRIYCAAQFPDMGLCAGVCELLNEHWPLAALHAQAGKYFRSVEHAMIEANP
jgi:hypothetical protein